LCIFGLICQPHATVKGTVKDMKRSGWRLIKKPKKGAVFVWEEKEFSKNDIHPHIGFYFGPGQTISNSHSKGQPACHHQTYNNKRKITAIFWHRKLN